MASQYSAVKNDPDGYSLSTLNVQNDSPRGHYEYERQVGGLQHPFAYSSSGMPGDFYRVGSDQNTGYDTDGSDLPTKMDSLGRGVSKPVIEYPDVLIFLLALVCFVIAAVVVYDDGVAWNLGYSNQIVAVGFLLSIMNICLLCVAPISFLHLEARFGNSTLQNFDALGRLKPLGSQVDWWWRATMALLLTLPIGLSVVYKLRTFAGGVGVMPIHETNGLYSSEFGMYGPPGTLPLGWNTGIILMFNATAPFLQASTTPGTNLTDLTYGDPALDPPLPAYPKPYGFNTLLLNATATAMLDAPPVAWIEQVQKTLGPGDAFNISAVVLATVTVQNESVDAYRNESFGDSPGFWDLYSENGANMPHFTNLFNNYTIGLLTNQLEKANMDESWCFVGITPEPSEEALANDYTTATNNFASVAKMFSTSRQDCYAKWTITEGAVLLTDGHCGSDVANIIDIKDRQLVLQNNVMYLIGYYQPVLVEFLALFATTRNQSHWLNPTMTTTVASMYWSRLAAMDGPGSPHWPGHDSFGHLGELVVTDHAGLLYNSTATITSIRPAVRKSPVIFVVLAVQPFITALMILATAFSYHVAVSRGFGVVAILAGIQRDSLRLLEGAGFSGNLTRPTRLNIVVNESEHQKGRVTYFLDTVEYPERGRVKRGWLYR